MDDAVCLAKLLTLFAVWICGCSIFVIHFNHSIGVIDLAALTPRRNLVRLGKISSKQKLALCFKA